MKLIRPLTKEEGMFAAANHALVYRFLNEKGLSPDAFYDVVIFGYLHAVQNYLSEPRFLAYSFSTVAWKQMQNALQSYYRYCSAPKRSGDVVRFSDPVNAPDPLTWGEVLTENNAFVQFETRELLAELEKKLPAHEMKIVRMKLKGCKMHEIAKTEHLTFREINLLLADCRDDIIRILWGEEEERAA